MDRHSIVLRAANPTFDEGLAFARYLDEAAEGFFRFMLGRRVGYITATAFAQPDHDLSYQNGLSQNVTTSSWEWPRGTRRSSIAVPRANPCSGLPEGVIYE